MANIANLDRPRTQKDSDTYSQLVRHQLSIPVDIWDRHSLLERWVHNAKMAGSTSDDQSIFDTPSSQDNDGGKNLRRQSSESSASPPNDASCQEARPSAYIGDEGSASATAQAQNAKLKRIACIICRKRKLKCDGARPRCSTCARLRHECGYDETRKKSGPKRGYVKELEKRLKQIETQLKSDAPSNRDKSPSSLGAAFRSQGFDPTQTGLAGGLLGAVRSPSMDPNMANRGVDSDAAEGFPWEMIGLGLEEPLPHQEMINELHSIYFDNLHTSMPMIHKYRYLAAMNLSPGMRPPIALRYALWAYAASATDKFQNFQEMFYQRARKYAELDEMRGFGEQVFTVGHVQAWTIIANYEFKMLYFPRAWMSVGRAVRLAQMLGLYRVDGGGLEVKECLGPARDWVDKEERRRTFWAAYCFDRWASIGTGWPMNIDERDIHTDLPVSDDAFDKGKEEKGLTLAGILSGIDPAKLSSYASVILMASIIGKTLTHLHRTDGRDDASDTESSDFWQRHRYLDRILENTNVCLPAHLKFGPGITDPNVIFLHLNIHSTAICLHQAAILKAEQNNLDMSIIKSSTERCYAAATEIANIWQAISHTDISFLSPYVAFCLFVAARVFVHSYRKNPDDSATRHSLHFLLSAMEAHRKRNDITESFLIQLLADLDEMGFDSVILKRHQAFVSKRNAYSVYQESSRCAPILKPHSTAQPTARDLRRQEDAQKLAAMFGQNGNAAVSEMDSQLNIPIRPGAGPHQMGMNGHHLSGDQLHSVSLGQDYDLNVQFAHQPGLSPNSQNGGFGGQNGFGLASQASPSTSQHSTSNMAGPGAGDAHHVQQANFFGQGDFDMNILNEAFDMGQDPNMMHDIQNTQWPNMNVRYPDGTQSTPAAAWADFI